MTITAPCGCKVLVFKGHGTHAVAPKPCRTARELIVTDDDHRQLLNLAERAFETGEMRCLKGAM